ncbi:hypothetical protein PVMG_05947 [Plasmodium vivax Mauritania I]|uniref:Uncharacterized protein n=1 Tax=Plasmodium vivax Mauritania I TaxID=1035515 RepID=A0A0J9W443_PLAVI|nr:hypothetical protein PVMG_05947 [Plasmodium vivax Mauritania I]
MKISIFVHSIRGKNMNIIFFLNCVILKISFIIYLTYDCYIDIKNYFKSINPLSEYGRENLGKAIKSMIPRTENMESIHSIFEELATFFRGYHAFIAIGLRPSCIYVNYWLNDKLRDLYYYNDKYKFDVFKDFSHRFAIEDSSFRNSCKNDMDYYNKDKWDRMKFLYQWYEKFEDFISSNRYKTDSKCSEIAYLRREFNVFIDEHDGKDKELMDKLIKFKDFLPKKLLQINEQCKNQIDYFKYPPQEEQRRAAEQAQRQIDQITLIIPPNGEPSQQLIDISGKDQLLEKQKRPLEGFPSRIRGDSEGQLFTGTTRFTSGSLREHTESLEYQVEKNTELENANIDPALTPGVFGALKNTITGVLKEVDPVPVVGVSGGMGALFLLFRVLKILNH